MTESAAARKPQLVGGELHKKLDEYLRGRQTRNYMKTSYENLLDMKGRYREAWKRMAARMEATVLTLHKTPFGTKPVVATDTTSLFAAKTADEAHYLCAILNSRTVDEYIRSFSSGGRGFGAPSVVKNLAIPPFAEDTRIHRRLSGLSRRARDGELLWLFITDPQQKRFERRNILLRNRVACALADVVFVPFSEKGAKTFITIKQVLEDKVPIFTCQYGADKVTDVNKDLFALGIPSYPRKTVGDYLESLGASIDAPPPFPLKPDASPDAGQEPVALNTKPRQISFL